MATSIRILFDQSDSGKIHQHFTNVKFLEKGSNDSVSVSPFSSLLLFSHIRTFRSLWLSVTHSTFEWKTGERQHPMGRDTETKPKSLCMAPALGSRRFSLGYTNVPRPRVSVTQTCTITKRRPSSEPCISVRWGYLDLLSACCLCDGF